MSKKSEDLQVLLDDVTKQIISTMKKAEAPLAKADPGKEAPAEKTPAGDSAEGSKEGSAPAAPPAPAHSEPDGDEGQPGPGDGDADNAAPAPDAGSPGGTPEAPEGGEGDPAAETGESVGSLEEQYSALPINELITHIQSAMNALSKLAGGAGAGGSPAAPPAPVTDAPAPAASPTPPPPAMGKKEFSAGEGSGGQMTGGTMAKSERDFSALEGRLQSLEKSVKEKDDLIKAKEDQLADQGKKFSEAAEGLTKLIKITQLGRKAITGASFAAPESTPEITMTKSEISAKCVELASDPSLKKSDREAINQYVAGGQPVKVIAHLLKK